MEKNLQKLFEKYLNESQFSACLSPETMRGYNEVFKLFLRVMPEVMDVDSLTPEMLNEFFKRIKTRHRIVGKNTIKTGVKNSTIKTQRSKLNIFFNWLYNKGFLKENPLKNIKSPKVSYDDSRKLEDTDIHKIYAAITLHSINSLILRRDILMVSLLTFCGLRKGEFISLRVADIDLNKELLTVRAETSKSKRVRVLKLHITLILQIKDYLRERNLRGLKSEFLIVSSRGDRGLSREGLKHWVNSLIKKSGVKFHLHRFRHTFAYKLTDANVNLFKIQKLMGHSDIKTTMRYARSLRTEEMGEDINKISI